MLLRVMVCISNNKQRDFCKMKIVVLGSSGQLACSLKKTQNKNLDVVYLSHKEAPFENFEQIKTQLEKIRPSHVINAVAYTKVDLAESEKDLCFLINSETPAKIAKWCNENGAVFFHYSTDYVFNGENEVAWVEDSTPNPLNIYGKSKLNSEKEVLAFKTSYVFRTSWVYSEYGQNFVKTMIRLFQEREELAIVSDQIGAPNYAPDLARATWDILIKAAQPGLYHMSSSSFCSWYEFAMKIEEYSRELGLKFQIKRISPISTKDYKTAAQRPLNSRLNSVKMHKTFGIQLPAWETSLKICVSELLKG